MTTRATHLGRTRARCGIQSTPEQSVTITTDRDGVTCTDCLYACTNCDTPLDLDRATEDEGYTQCFVCRDTDATVAAGERAEDR